MGLWSFQAIVYSEQGHPRVSNVIRCVFELLSHCRNPISSVQPHFHLTLRGNKLVLMGLCYSLAAVRPGSPVGHICITATLFMYSFHSS